MFSLGSSRTASHESPKGVHRIVTDHAAELRPPLDRNADHHKHRPDHGIHHKCQGDHEHYRPSLVFAMPLNISPSLLTFIIRQR